MPLFKLNDVAGLKRFEGWEIIEILALPAGISLLLGHPDYETKQKLLLKAHILVGMNGNLTVHNSALNIELLDVVKSEA